MPFQRKDYPTEQLGIAYARHLHPEYVWDEAFVLLDGTVVVSGFKRDATRAGGQIKFKVADVKDWATERMR